MRFRGLRTPAIVCGCVLGIVGIAVAYSATLPSAPADRARPAHPVSAASGPSELRAQAAAARESQLNEARWSRASKKAHATDTPLIDSCTGKPMSGPYHFITSKAECRAPKSTSGARPARTPAIPPDSFAGRLTPAQWKRANDYALAASTYCLRISESRMPTDSEIGAEITAVDGLQDLLRRDPDTYYRVPGRHEHRTMRQLVGETRDALASYDCEPSGAQKLQTALETLPRD